MTTSPPARAPPQPLSKAPFTVQSSLLDAVASNGNGSSKSNPKAQLKARPARLRQETPGPDFASESATLSLIRRILVSDKTTKPDLRASPRPIEDILPPLTSSNDVDVQLYAIVAIIIKDFVNTWYANITPDHQFVDEVLQIIAHCSRAVEQRLRHVDIVELLLDEIPVLLERHFVAYQTAVNASAGHSYSTEVNRIYHTLNPHPALDPCPDVGNFGSESEQQHNEFIYRQLLVNGALAVLLPTDDFRNAPLRLLVGDIIADLIIGQAVAGKVCEGWFLHETIIKVINVINERIQPKASGQELRQETKTRLEKFGLLNTENDATTAQSSATSQSVVSVWFWQVLQCIFFVFLTIRFIFRGLSQAGSTPHRSLKRFDAGVSPTVSKRISEDQGCHEIIRPVLDYNLYSTVATILHLTNRMPWLISTFMFLQHMLLQGFGQIAAPNSVLDRFLHNTIQTHVFPPSIIPPILFNLRIALFPNNTLGPPAPPAPSIEERFAIRRKAAESILSLIPPVVARTFFNTSNNEEILQTIEEEILDVFGDSYLNGHLVYGILELVLCRLIPELTEGSVSDILAERGVSLGGEK